MCEPHLPQSFLLLNYEYFEACVPYCESVGGYSACWSVLVHHEEVFGVEAEEEGDDDAGRGAADGAEEGARCGLGLGAGLFIFIFPPFHLIYVVNAKTALFRANLM